jgi:fluoride exporter
MWQIILIALAGAVGAVARFGLANGCYLLLGRDFPYGTLLVNVLGSLFMGFLAIWLVDKALSPELKIAILVGLLGSFTTFSAFSWDSLQLIEQQLYFKAMLNIVAHLLLCLGMTWLGMLLARLS